MKTNTKNLKLVGISALFLSAIIIGLTAGYFSSHKTADDKATFQKSEQKTIEPNGESAELKKLKIHVKELIINFNTKLTNLKRDSKGQTGPAGLDGMSGLPGIRGNDGGTGIPGERGQQGKIGLDGKQGAMGLQGERGKQGRQGETGAAGQQGEPGSRGNQGEVGGAGAQGERGLQGPTGKPGLRGATGPEGARGRSGAQGDRGPRGEVGLRGQQGKIGLTGAEGVRGLPGKAGNIGQEGKAGQRGERGKQGLPGEAGAQGLRGLRGSTANIDELAKKVETKLATTKLLTEFKKLLDDSGLKASILNSILIPGIKTIYFDSWINLNKSWKIGQDIDQTNHIHPVNKDQNTFWKISNHIFPDLKMSNNYLFRHLNGSANEPNRYGLYGKVAIVGEKPDDFYLVRYSELSTGNYQKWTGITVNNVKILSQPFPVN